MRRLFVLVLFFMLCSGSVFAQTLSEMKTELEQLKSQQTYLLKTANGLSDTNTRKLNDINQRIKKLTYDIKAEEHNQNIETTRQHVNQYMDEQANKAIKLMENLKTCTRSGEKLFLGNTYVLGSRNGVCYYQMPFGSRSVLCSFPMSMVQKYAQEAIWEINTGKSSSYIESAHEKYCKFRD